MTEEKKELEEINISLQALKRLVYFLILIVLVLSAVLNIFILQSNRQLRQQLGKASYENSQLRYERNLMDAFIREIEGYARGNAEVEKIIAKYRIQKKTEAQPPGAGNEPGAID